MLRVCIAVFLCALAAFAANFRLYLKDGTYHIVREYEVKGDRVRFYSVERSDWEEMPLAFVDLKRTENENVERKQTVEKEAAEIAAEEKFERQQREERERVPVEPGVYTAEGSTMRTIKQAESKAVNSKGRSILKVLSPVPVVSGKTTVELDGEHSQNVMTGSRPEFYMRPSRDERFGIVKMMPKKGVRVVQELAIVPVTKEIVEKQEDVEVFRKQVDEGLYKIWPAQPLAPGEYGVIEFTPGKGNVQTWDFSLQAAQK